MTSQGVSPVAATPVVPAARRNLLSQLEGAGDEPRTKEEWSSEPRQQSAMGRKQTPNTGQQQQQQQPPRGRSLDEQARALVDAQSVAERVAALQSLADLSSSADLSIEELGGAIRDTAGCVELLCRLLHDDSKAVVSAALVVLGNFAADSTPSDLVRLRSTGGTDNVFRILIDRSEGDELLHAAVGACMNFCRNAEEAAQVCRMGIFVRLDELQASDDAVLSHFASSALANVRESLAPVLRAELDRDEFDRDELDRDDGPDGAASERTHAAASSVHDALCEAVQATLVRRHVRAAMRAWRRRMDGHGRHDQRMHEAVQRILVPRLRPDCAWLMVRWAAEQRSVQAAWLTWTCAMPWYTAQRRRREARSRRRAFLLWRTTAKRRADSHAVALTQSARQSRVRAMVALRAQILRRGQTDATAVAQRARMVVTRRKRSGFVSLRAWFLSQLRIDAMVDDADAHHKQHVCMRAVELWATWAVDDEDCFERLRSAAAHYRRARLSKGLHVWAGHTHEDGMAWAEVQRGADHRRLRFPPIHAPPACKVTNLLRLFCFPPGAAMQQRGKQDFCNLAIWQTPPLRDVAWPRSV